MFPRHLRFLEEYFMDLHGLGPNAGFVSNALEVEEHPISPRDPVGIEVDRWVLIGQFRAVFLSRSHFGRGTSVREATPDLGDSPWLRRIKLDLRKHGGR